MSCRQRRDHWHEYHAPVDGDVDSVTQDLQHLLGVCGQRKQTVGQLLSISPPTNGVRSYALPRQLLKPEVSDNLYLEDHYMRGRRHIAAGISMHAPLFLSDSTERSIYPIPNDSGTVPKEGVHLRAKDALLLCTRRSFLLR